MSVIETQKEFKEKIAKVNTTMVKGFGIAISYHGQENVDKVLMAKFPVANWGKNFGSAAVMMLALKEQGIEVDTSKSEQIFDINEEFVCSCLNMFYPFQSEIDEDETGEKHQNIQVLNYLNYLNAEEKEFQEDENATIFYDELDKISYLDYKEDGCIQNVKYKVVFVFDDKAPVQSVEAATLQLYAISQADVEPRELPLNGAFGIFENIAKSAGDPLELAWLRKHKIKMEIDGIYPKIDMIDKFGTYLDYILPNVDNTRILDAYKVRFGAQLAAGTTVMPGASYINFNAGTLGSVMVEGRISSSAIVGAGSDVGGGASILGVLSGTDGNPISIGENCLLGANSVCGIPLGDGCIIDAGVTILEGTKVRVSAEESEKISDVNKANFKVYVTNKDIGFMFKGKDISYLNGIHFRQDSKTGKITAFRSTRKVELNADLH